MQWQPIETCPEHKEVLFFRDDAGVFFGEYTYCAEWVSEQEIEEHGYTEDCLFSMDVWAFTHQGAFRCDGDLKPTHWMPLPAPPAD